MTYGSITTIISLIPLPKTSPAMAGPARPPTTVLDLYQLPSAPVPHYLQGRPPTVVKHCLIQKTKSSKYTKDKLVCTKSPGVFHVMKDTKNTQLTLEEMVALWVVHIKIERSGIFLASIFLQHFAGNVIGIGINSHWNIDKVPT